MVKIIVSPGFGAGWSTWEHDLDDEGKKLMLSWPPLIAAIEAEEEVMDWDEHPAYLSLVEALKGVRPYTGGLRKAIIEEVPRGVPFFIISEYDGSETLNIVGGPGFLVF